MTAGIKQEGNTNFRKQHGKKHVHVLFMFEILQEQNLLYLFEKYVHSCLFLFVSNKITTSNYSKCLSLFLNFADHF